MDSKCTRKAWNGNPFCKTHQTKRDKLSVLKCSESECDQPREKGTECCFQHNQEQFALDNDDFAQYMEQFEGAVFMRLSDSAGVIVVLDGEAPEGAAAGLVRKAAVVIDIASDNEVADESPAPVAPPAPPAVDAGDAAAAAGLSEDELASILLSLDPSGSSSPASAPTERAVDSKALCERMLNMCLTKKPPVLHTFNSAAGRYERVLEVQPFLTRLADDARLRKLHHAAKRVQADAETVARLEKQEKDLRALLELCRQDQDEDRETFEAVEKIYKDHVALMEKRKPPDGGH